MGIGGVRQIVVIFLYAAWLSGAVADTPTIAIVIDDLGYLAVNDRDVLSLDERVAVAIIPDGPLAPKLSRKAASQKRDILIHLPLSGVSHDDCEFEATCVDPDWSPSRMADHLRWAAERVDQAIGINNHQGSLFTSEHEAVRRLVAAITLLERSHGIHLFVLDSRTTPCSRLEEQAREAGLATARRNVFLDHDPSPEAIASAWAQLLEQARRHGSAIAIGHPRRQTIEFLEQAVPQLAHEGVELVRVSQLLRRVKASGNTDKDLPVTLP
jgi:uncharacterized protein